jgi:hypothetical protein
LLGSDRVAARERLRVLCVAAADCREFTEEDAIRAIVSDNADWTWETATAVLTDLVAGGALRAFGRYDHAVRGRCYAVTAGAVTHLRGLTSIPVAISWLERAA